MSADPVALSGASPLNLAAAATTTSSITDSYSLPYGVKSLLVCAVYGTHDTVAFTNTMTMSGRGLTWNKLLNVFTNSDKEQLTIFAAAVPAVGYAAGTCTITLSQTPISGLYCFVAVPYYDGPASAVHTASGTGTGTSGTATFSTLDTTSCVLAFSAHFVNERVTPATTWTELLDGGTTDTNLEAQYLTHSVPAAGFVAGGSWATSSRWMFGAVELDVAGDPAVRIANVDGSGELTVEHAIDGEVGEDDDGPNTPGNPSGVWAILSG